MDDLQHQHQRDGEEAPHNHRVDDDDSAGPSARRTIRSRDDDLEGDNVEGQMLAAPPAAKRAKITPPSNYVSHPHHNHHRHHHNHHYSDVEMDMDSPDNEDGDEEERDNDIDIVHNAKHRDASGYSAARRKEHDDERAQEGDDEGGDYEEGGDHEARGGGGDGSRGRDSKYYYYDDHNHDHNEEDDHDDYDHHHHHNSRHLRQRDHDDEEDYDDYEEEEEAEEEEEEEEEDYDDDVGGDSHNKSHRRRNRPDYNRNRNRNHTHNSNHNRMQHQHLRPAGAATPFSIYPTPLLELPPESIVRSSSPKPTNHPAEHHTTSTTNTRQAKATVGVGITMGEGGGGGFYSAVISSIPTSATSSMSSLPPHKQSSLFPGNQHHHQLDPYHNRNHDRHRPQQNGHYVHGHDGGIASSPISPLTRSNMHKKPLYKRANPNGAVEKQVGPNNTNTDTMATLSHSMVALTSFMSQIASRQMLTDEYGSALLLTELEVLKNRFLACQSTHYARLATTRCLIDQFYQLMLVHFTTRVGITLQHAALSQLRDLADDLRSECALLSKEILGQAEVLASNSLTLVLPELSPLQPHLQPKEGDHHVDNGALSGSTTPYITTPATATATATRAPSNTPSLVETSPAPSSV